MAVTFIKDIKKYTKDGKYYFTVLFRNTGDDLGWRTETKEFFDEEELRGYIMQFCSSRFYQPLPFSPFSRFLNRSIESAKISKTGESYQSIFYRTFDVACQLFSKKFRKDQRIAIKRTLIYLPKQERYKVSYSKVILDGVIVPESCKFSATEVYTLGRESRDLLKGFTGHFENKVRLGKF